MGQIQRTEISGLAQHRTERESGIPDWVILVAFCLIFSTQVLFGLAGKSATFDEPLNLASGYISWRFGDDRLVPQNLPLVKLLGSVPLLALPHLTLPSPPSPWSQGAQYLYGSDFLYRYNDADTILLLARSTLLAIPLLFGFLLFQWSRQLWGQTAAIVALLLFTFEPNILAHSGLITTDMATACFMFLTIYGCFRLAEKVTWPRLLVPGVAFGLSLVAKYSSLSLCFVIGFLMTVLIFSDHPIVLQLKDSADNIVQGRMRKLTLCVLFGLVSIAVAWIVIWSMYGFHFDTATSPISTYHTPWDHFLGKESASGQLVRFARDLHLLPEPYLYGLGFMLNLSGGFQSYLLGQVRTGGWWYYFILSFFIKTPIPLLLLLAGSVIPWRTLYLRDPLRTAFILGAPAIYFLSISTSGWNIGHRHLLPILPFCFMLIGALTASLKDRAPLLKQGITALVCWFILESSWISPDYLAYFNQSVGGPDNGHQYLVDSNLDWGQDLKGLKKYMDQQGIDRVWLGYFGQADPGYYGIRFDYLPSYDIFHPGNMFRQVWEWDSLPPLPGVVAISATLLEGAYLPFQDAERSRRYYQLYRTLSPVARIGHSILVFEPIRTVTGATSQFEVAESTQTSPH